MKHLKPSDIATGSRREFLLRQERGELAQRIGDTISVVFWSSALAVTIATGTLMEVRPPHDRQRPPPAVHEESPYSCPCPPQNNTMPRLPQGFQRLQK